jgi:hypothetical protein
MGSVVQASERAKGSESGPARSGRNRVPDPLLMSLVRVFGTQSQSPRPEPLGPWGSIPETRVTRFLTGDPPGTLAREGDSRKAPESLDDFE